MANTKQVVLIQNNHGGMLTLQCPGPKLQDGSVQNGPLVVLPPGVKPVDAELWARVKENPTVRLMLRHRIPPNPAPEQDQRMVGKFLIVEGPVLPAQNPLKTMKIPDAITTVRETLDTETLEEWLEPEAREEVRKAIRAQIQSINKPMLARGHSRPAPGVAEDGDGAGDDAGGGGGGAA